MMLAPQPPAGPFTWTTLRLLGFRRHQLNSWLCAREVRRVLRGVYVRADLPDDQITRARAAFLVMKPFAILCDRTAGWVHGVDAFGVRDLEILPPLETWVLRNSSRVRREGCVGGERDLAPHDVMQVEDVPLTTPLRTALDLGCRLRRREALAALDAFMRAHRITLEQFKTELPRYRRRRGVVQLRELINLADPRSESAGESWTRLCIIDEGLPPPQPQYWVESEGRRVRLDLAYPRRKIAIEYDEVDFHESTAQRLHDEGRREWLRVQGWTVIVVRKDAFKGERLAAWLTELKQALRLSDVRDR